MGSLCSLPGGIGRFVPCDIGANHCRLRHIGWEKCGHGLSSRSRESASEGLLNELLLLFRYPSRLAAALLEGTLPLRYCAGRFASRIPTWRLPADGHVADLVAEGGEEVGVVHEESSAPAVLSGFGGGGGVGWISGPGGGVQRVRLNRKTPAHLVSHSLLEVQSRPRVWKRLRIQKHPGHDHVDAKAGRSDAG